MLIGGATTSKQHTAVKIDPQRSGRGQPVVHVLDASKSVVVCNHLLDENQREEFLDDIADLYEDIREDHYENLKERRYLSLEQARAKSLRLEFNPTKPSFFGTRVFSDYDLSELLPYIDWKYFFDVWQLRGRYPNGRYPKIFNDEKVGEEASRLFEDAQMMLRQVIDQQWLKATAIIGFYPANSVGDDIHVFANDKSTNNLHPPLAVFHGLRQQMEVEGQKNYLCISDFVAPLQSGIQDYIGKVHYLLDITKNQPLGGALKLLIDLSVKMGPFLALFSHIWSFLFNFWLPFCLLLVLYGSFWFFLVPYRSILQFILDFFCPFCASAENRSESKQTKRWPPSGEKMTKTY